jgi:hypothetical protein
MGLMVCRTVPEAECVLYIAFWVTKLTKKTKGAIFGPILTQYFQKIGKFPHFQPFLWYDNDRYPFLFSRI